MSLSSFPFYQYALRKGEPITPRDAVYKTKKAKDRGEAIDFFRRLEEMGWGQTITTPRTIKFEAFEERKSSPPKTTTVTTATSEETSSHNHTQPSQSNNPGSTTNVTATTTDRSHTALIERNTENSVPSITNARHQPETKKSLDNQSRLTSPHKSIDDFQVGQKVRVDGLQLIITAVFI